jgi:hypothetical protein
LSNKEWIFSGIGFFILSGIAWLIRYLFFSNSVRTEGKLGGQPQLKFQNKSNNYDKVAEIPNHWQGIIPPQSSIEYVDEIADSIPGGLQSFSFVYGPRGHSKALILNNTIVQAEIQFTCQVFNPVKAMFGANEYALNVLQPRFLIQSRSILEKFSLKKLRENRNEIAQNILDQLSPQFEELGFHLESVTIGALEQIK